jgi:hypothetical protein
MNEQAMWSFAKSVGGVGGTLLIGGLIAWKAGLFTWIGNLVGNRASSENLAKINSDVTTASLQRLQEENHRLAERIKSKDAEMTATEDAFRLRMSNKMKEKDEEIDRLEEMYKGMASQVRQARQ